MSKGQDLFRRHCTPFTNDNNGLDQFSCGIVWYTNHRRIRNSWMLQQQRFQFSWCHTEAFVLDQFLFALNDICVPIGIYMTNIAGVEPAVAYCAGRLLWRFPVALHNLWTANNNLAIFTHWQLALTSLDIHHFLLSIVNGHANTAQPYQTRIARLRMGQRRCFRHPITLHNWYTSHGL